MPKRRHPVFRRTPSQERSIQTVDAIIEATSRVLTEEGYQACTTNRVAQLAGVSIGSLYQYFPDKASLILALLQRELGRTEEQLTAAMKASAGLPLEEGIPALVKVTLEAFRGRADLCRVLVQDVPRFSALRRFHETHARYEGPLETWLRAHPTGAEGPAPAMAAMVLVSLVAGLLTRSLVSQPEWLDDRRLEQDLTRAVLGYLRPGG